MEYLARNGGLADAGGELRGLDADAWHRAKPFMNRLVREDGRSLQDAAVAAQELGYLPERYGEGDNRSAPQDLIDAIRDELAGKARYAREDARGVELQQHIQDLDEVLNHIGVDPARASNADLKAAIQRYFDAPETSQTLDVGPEGPSSALDNPVSRTLASINSTVPTPRTNQMGPLLSPEAAAAPVADGPTSGRGAQSAFPEPVPVVERLGATPQRGVSAEAIARLRGALGRDEALPQARLGMATPPRGTVDIEGVLAAASRPAQEHAPERARLAPVSGWLHGEGRAAGLELDGYNHVLDASAVRHIRKNHGDPQTERKRGQLEVTDADLRAIPEVIASPDKVAFGTEGRTGLAQVAYLKEMPDGSILHLEEVRTGRRELAAVSMRKYPATISETSLARILNPNGRTDGGNGLKIVDGPAASKPTRLGAIDLSLNPSRNIGGLRQAPRPGAIAKANGGGAPRAQAASSVSKLATDLRSALGLTHRQGRMTLKGGAVGEYDPHSGVIRTKAYQELDVLGHEATHALEYRKSPGLTTALKKHAAHLKTLAYPGANEKHLRQEGFAEFGRWYLTNPDVARRLGGAFYADFETAMAKDDPDSLAAMKGIQAAYADLLKTASVDVAKGALAYTGRPGLIGRVKQTIKHQGVGGAMKSIFDDAYASYIDDLHPINRAVRELQDIYAANHGKRLDLNVAQNPYALARLARDAYAAGQVDLLDGVVPYKGLDPDSPALADAVEKALGGKTFGKWKQSALDDFDTYLISRRMVHLWDRYDAGKLERPPDRSSGKDFHERVIADLEGANPTFSDAAGIVYKWNQALWKKEFEAGMITQEAHEQGLRDHPDYVPLMRDISDKDAGGGSSRGAKGSLQFSGGVRQLRGSTRDVISPLSSMIRRAYELNTIIRRNDVLKALDDLGQAAGVGSGAIVERLPAKEIQAIHVNAVEALEKAARQAGLSERDVTTMVAGAETMLEGQTDATIFRAAEFGPRKGESVVFVWRDGKKTPLLLPDGQFGKDMFDAFTGMNKDSRSAVVDVMATTTMLLRQGVTLSPEFMTRNFVRDQLATWINTDVGFKPGISSLVGAGHEIARTSTAKHYAVAGGMRAGVNLSAMRKPIPLNDAEAMAQLQTLRKKGYRIRRYAGLRGLTALTDLSEVSTRLGVFALATRQAKKRGLNDWEAVLEGAFTSRDYLDFGRRGSKMIAAARVVTFLNAALQSLDKSIRVQGGWGNLRGVVAPAYGKAPATPAEKRALALAVKATARIGALGVFGGILTAMYSDDPEYKDINNRLRATHWFAKVGGKWISIPKPFELAEPSNIIERAYEGAVLKDPRWREHMVSDFLHAVAPPHAIPMVAVPFGIAANKDGLGRPIVPDYLKGTVDPEMQVTAYTSGLSKAISAAIGAVTDATGERHTISPAVIDYTITGFGGSLGRYLLQGSNWAQEKVTGKPSTATDLEDRFITRGFVRDVKRSSNSQEDFWDLVSRDGGKLTRAEGTFRTYVKQGNDAKAAEYLNGLDPQARAYVRAKVFSTDGSAKYHPLVRAQEALSVINEVRRETREGTLKGVRGDPIVLTPKERMELDDALAGLARAEMRSALVVTGAKGWEPDDIIPRRDALAQLDAASPPVAALLSLRLRLARVPEVSQAGRWWGSNRDKLEAPADPSRLSVQNSRERLDSNDRWDKLQEQNRRRAPPTPVAMQKPQSGNALALALDRRGAPNPFRTFAG